MFEFIPIEILLIILEKLETIDLYCFLKYLIQLELYFLKKPYFLLYICNRLDYNLKTKNVNLRYGKFINRVFNSKFCSFCFKISRILLKKEIKNIINDFKGDNICMICANNYDYIHNYTYFRNVYNISYYYIKKMNLPRQLWWNRGIFHPAKIILKKYDIVVNKKRKRKRKKRSNYITKKARTMVV